MMHLRKKPQRSSQPVCTIISLALSLQSERGNARSIAFNELIFYYKLNIKVTKVYDEFIMSSLNHFISLKNEEIPKYQKSGNVSNCLVFYVNTKLVSMIYDFS